VLGLASLGLVMFVVLHVAFQRQLDSMVSDDARALAEEFRADGDQELADEIREREAIRSPNHMLYAVFAPDGTVLHGSLQAKRPAPGLHPIDFYDPGEGADTARAMTIDLSPSERLVVASDSEWFEKVEAYVIWIFAAAFLGVCVLGFGGAVILGSYLRRRLRSISGSAEAIIGGDIRQRMPVGPQNDEFDHLASTLNRMLDRIESLLESLRQVSSDIAHDLKTPLARLRNRLERGALEGSGSDALIDDAIHQLDEALSLFEAILRVAEVESGETKRFFAPVDLSAMLTELAESYAPAFEDERRRLSWSIEPDLKVDGDRELLAQAVINLLENAQRHTPAGTAVRLAAKARAKGVSIEVADEGPGVPDADLGRITKRFARLESSRNTAGHGLGLSLVRAVARLHGGELILTNDGPGLRATISVPGKRAARRSRAKREKQFAQ
jgi:signal transduction histidine kinase